MPGLPSQNPWDQMCLVLRHTPGQSGGSTGICTLMEAVNSFSPGRVLMRSVRSVWCLWSCTKVLVFRGCWGWALRTGRCRGTTSPTLSAERTARKGCLVPSEQLWVPGVGVLPAPSHPLNSQQSEDLSQGCMQLVSLPWSTHLQTMPGEARAMGDRLRTSGRPDM